MKKPPSLAVLLGHGDVFSGERLTDTGIRVHLACGWVDANKLQQHVTRSPSDNQHEDYDNPIHRMRDHAPVDWVHDAFLATYAF
jgi:hypothetical protein